MMTTREYRVVTPQGSLYAKRWMLSDGQASAHPPIVLFHDSLGCTALWRDFPEQLVMTTGREVIAYDRQGFGRSDPHPGVLDRHFICDEAGAVLAALRQQLGFTRFVAFGHSVGGAMATACAAAFPRDCEALVTESAQAFVEDRTLEGIRAAERDFAQAGQLDRLAKYHGDKALWVLRAWIDTWLSEDFRDWTLDAELAGVQCPLLSLHGEQDEFGSVLHPQRIAASVQGPSVLKILPDCGHVPHRQQPEVVLKAVGEFLATCAPVR